MKEHDSLPNTVLIIDDEESIRYTFSKFLENEGYAIQTARNYEEAMEILQNTRVDLVFADIKLGDKSGIDVLETIKQRNLDCLVLMVTGNPNIENAAAALRLGAFDYLTKPVRKERLLQTAKVALSHKKLNDEKLKILRENDRHRKHLHAIFQSVQDSIVTLDREMKVTAVNETAYRLFQTAGSELLQNLPLRPLDALCKTCLDAAANALSKQRAITVESLEYHTTENRRLNLTLSAMPLLDDRYHPIGVVVVIRDNTRMVELEEELLNRHSFHRIVGKSPAMQSIFQLINKLGDVDSTVLIRGASGTGKELIARAIHLEGHRKEQPFVAVNCAAIPATLLESELFGYAKGAFTGATAARMGRFEAANKGTLFLDEVGDIPPSIQVKLLRALQERSIERLGENKPIKVDVRILAATNANLEQKVSEGSFRSDLYYRLKVMEIVVPPLSERVEDIPLLIAHFCKRFNQRFQKTINGVSPAALAVMENYPWPGNVRELEHALERAYILCQESRIQQSHLPAEIAEYGPLPAAKSPSPEVPPEALREALRKTGGNKAKAARLLGISRQTIYRKIDKYDFRTD